MSQKKQAKIKSTTAPTSEKKGFKLEWHTEKRKVKDLKPYANNPRKMTDQQAQDLLDSLTRFNLAEIPAINTDNTILAGNMRAAALLKLGRAEEDIEVRVPNRKLNNEEAKEYLLRSNHNVGEWDFGKLEQFDRELLVNIGFSENELSNLVGDQLGDFDKPDIDAPIQFERINISFTEAADCDAVNNWLNDKVAEYKLKVIPDRALLLGKVMVEMMKGK